MDRVRLAGSPTSVCCCRSRRSSMAGVTTATGHLEDDQPDRQYRRAGHCRPCWHQLVPRTRSMGMFIGLVQPGGDAAFWRRALRSRGRGLPELRTNRTRAPTVRPLPRLPGSCDDVITLARSEIADGIAPTGTGRFSESKTRVVHTKRGVRLSSGSASSGNRRPGSPHQLVRLRVHRRTGRSDR